MSNSRQDDLEQRVANRFARRRRQRELEKNLNLLQKLKHAREAAGLPLNPIQAEINQNSSRHASRTGSEPDRLSTKARNSPVRNSPSTSNGGDVQSATNEVNSRPRKAVSATSFMGSRLKELTPSPKNTGNKPRYGTNIFDQTNAWHNDKSLTDCNLYMLKHEIGCDVMLLVGDAQKAMPVHSYVLISRSAKFAASLDTNDDKVIPVPNVDPETFEHFLRFLYTDVIELNVLLAAKLIPAADAYGQLLLMTKCFHFLMAEITDDNVCVTMELAHTFKQKSIFTGCLNFVLENTESVFQSRNFGNLCQECLEKIVKSDYLNAEEFSVYNAMITWANDACAKRKLHPTDASRRLMLGPLLYHTRFATMNAGEFTAKISNTNVLSAEEKILLFQYYHGERDRLPLKFNKKQRRHFRLDKTDARDQGNWSTEVLAYSIKQHKNGVPMQRAIRFQGLGKEWKMNGPDAISFRVSRPIVLFGAQIFGTYREDVESFNVKTIIYDEFKTKIRHEVIIIKHVSSKDVYDVVLKDPVRVPADRTFTVQVIIHLKSTFHGVGGLTHVQVDGVIFEFQNSNKSLNGTDVNIGQIPSLLFHKV